jgi:bifunctional UDP-N-acetylglucosamine pyrophosphorylase/glucosamine-1-phosphate N-acetyltransferase
MEVAVIVLAAGKGKRMKSIIPKVVHPILGRPMISYVLDAVMKINPKKIALVVGHGAEKVKEAVADKQVEWVLQEEQLGTGHAASCARKALAGFKGNVLILNGDFPLITPKTLKNFITSHNKSRASVSILTAILDNTEGYGRVVRSQKGEVLRVVEEKDATPIEKKLKEINSGAYCVESPFLWRALERIGAGNKQGEYYLPDVVNIASSQGKKVKGFVVTDNRELLGVNTRAELAETEEILRRRINHSLMLSGVTMVCPESTYISPDVSIGTDTVIHPYTFIYGHTRIGKGCVIGPSVWIEDSKIGNEVTIKFSSYIADADIKDKVTIGPFAHLRPQTKILSGAKIGNFVEVKKSRIGLNSRVPHLSYIGDAIVGEGVNIGAGTITCNYDGFQKYETTIEDDVFIGSDTMLVAPLKIGRGATTGAGSTITKDVPAGALAIGRAKQVVIENWKRKPKEKKESE